MRLFLIIFYTRTWSFHLIVTLDVCTYVLWWKRPGTQIKTPLPISLSAFAAYLHSNARGAGDDSGGTLWRRAQLKHETARSWTTDHFRPTSNRNGRDMCGRKEVFLPTGKPAAINLLSHQTQTCALCAHLQKLCVFRLILSIVRSILMFHICFFPSICVSGWNTAWYAWCKYTIYKMQFNAKMSAGKCKSLGH